MLHGAGGVRHVVDAEDQRDRQRQGQPKRQARPFDDLFHKARVRNAVGAAAGPISPRTNLPAAAQRFADVGQTMPAVVKGGGATWELGRYRSQSMS